MLRMNPHSSPNAAKEYFTGKLTKQECYSQDQELIGSWHGQGASRLGLKGNVTRATFAALCDNQHPVSGDRLTVRTKTNRTVGYDLNFHPPKAVSVLHALTQDQRVLEVFRNAVRATMQEIEKDAQTRIRVGNQDLNRPTGNLAWAEFIHFTGRPVNGIPDPHLHAHCFVFNATFDPAESRWKAGQFRDIKAQAPYYQAIFHNRLAAELEALGYGIRRQGLSFEVEGISEDINAKFSRRREVIDAEARKRNMTSGQARSKLGVMTREEKRPELTREGLHAEWTGRLTPAEQQAIKSLVPAPKPVISIVHDPQVAAKALAYAKDHCFERLSVVDERRLLATALQAGMGRVDPAKLREQLAGDSSFVRVERDGQKLLTTAAVRAEEERIVSWVRNGYWSAPAFLPSDPPRPAKLDDDLWVAMKHVLSSPDRVTGIRGKAGAGKTWLMRETITALEAANHRVTVLAPGADAARGTLAKEGFANAETVEHLLHRADAQAAARGGVWWIDEAGLLSVRDMARLMELADKLDARLILSGDTGQHRAVRRGDALRILQDHAGLELATLQKIRRQSGFYREAVEDLSENRLAAAFEKFEAMGAIHEINDGTGHRVLADAYLNALQGGYTALLVSPTHAEGRMVTELVREGLKRANKLANERTVPVLRPIDNTEANLRRPESYRPGWVIAAVKASPVGPVGNRHTVAAVEDGVVYVDHPDGSRRAIDVEAHADAIQLFEPGELPVAVGDRIRITKNGKALYSKARLNNGSLHTVVGFTEGGCICLDDGSIIPEDYAYIAHGYVTTSFAAQSKTIDKIFIAESSESFDAASREQFYVSVSRGRQELMIVTDSIDDLFEAVQVSSRRLAALDLDRLSTPPTRPLAEPEQPRPTNQVSGPITVTLDLPSHSQVWLGQVPDVNIKDPDQIDLVRRGRGPQMSR